MGLLTCVVALAMAGGVLGAPQGNNWGNWGNWGGNWGGGNWGSVSTGTAGQSAASSDPCWQTACANCNWQSGANCGACTNCYTNLYTASCNSATGTLKSQCDAWDACVRAAPVNYNDVNSVTQAWTCYCQNRSSDPFCAFTSNSASTNTNGGGAFSNSFGFGGRR